MSVPADETEYAYGASAQFDMLSTAHGNGVPSDTNGCSAPLSVYRQVPMAKVSIRCALLSGEANLLLAGQLDKLVDPSEHRFLAFRP
jgi:hypothetical protein